MGNLEEKSLEELEQLLANPAALEDEPEPETAEVEEPAEPESEPAAEEEPQDTGDEPVDEPVEEPTEQVAAPDTDEPAPELSIEDQIRKTLIDEAEARAKHFESVAGRNAGELGFVRKQLEALRQQLAAASQPAAPTVDEYGAEVTQAQAPQQPTPRALDAISSWAVSQAVRNSAAEFQSQHQDFSELSSDISQYLKDKQYDASSLLESNDPLYAAREATRALDEAYWHARGQHQARVRAQLEEKRADQIRNLEQAKLRGGPTQSGATPTPKPVAKTLDELTVDELREELERLSQ